MLVVVPVVVWHVVRCDSVPVRIAVSAAANFFGVIVTQLIGFFLIYDIEMTLIGRSLGLNPDGFWPAEPTPEQEAYIARLISDAWRFGAIAWTLVLAPIHTLAFGGLVARLAAVQVKRGAGR